VFWRGGGDCIRVPEERSGGCRHHHSCRYLTAKGRYLFFLLLFKKGCEPVKGGVVQQGIEIN
jgi:hypothetical protein